MAGNKQPFYVDGEKAEELAKLHDRALEEVINAICAKLGEGKKPKRVGWPEVSMRENGMPSISDQPLFGGNGPLKYSGVLEPDWNDDRRRAKGKFPADEFPAMAQLIGFVTGDPLISQAYMEPAHPDLLSIFIQLAVEEAANMHFLRFGEAFSTDRTRSSVLRKVLAGLTAKQLHLALVIPIAMVRFDFDRVRLAKDAILIRMSPGLQRARWTGKAWGANGHDSVLASATHAVVFTDRGMPNMPNLQLSQNLSRPDAHVTEVVDLFFAAFRLELGIDTGYAQELRLAKGWCAHDRLGDPEVFAVGARKYPAYFDDFGWTAENLPIVDRASIGKVAGTWQALQGIKNKHFDLALRRFNTAMTRDDPADALLDATIAMEILLGDDDSQSISWKLRMRAAALVGIDEDRARMEDMRKAILDTYSARSAIVHGSKKSKQVDQHAAADNAIKALREIITHLVAHPRYMDPLTIDAELLLHSAVSKEPKEVWSMGSGASH